MSRRCSLCPTSAMPEGVFHLHELEEGARFTFRGAAHLGPFVLTATTPTRCAIETAGAPPPPKDVAFETRFGGPVTFQAAARRASQPCTPCAMVVAEAN